MVRGNRKTKGRKNICRGTENNQRKQVIVKWIGNSWVEQGRPGNPMARRNIQGGRYLAPGECALTRPRAGFRKAEWYHRK